MTSRGTSRRRLPSSSRLALAALFVVGAAPAASAEARHADLAFTRVVGDTSTVWIADADGSNARRVAFGAAPRLSADAKWVAYLRLARPRGVYVIPTAGGRVRRVGNGDYAWSPRGARLALATGRTLELVEPLSRARRTLVRAPDLTEPSFAPDGHAIVYVRSTVHGPNVRSDLFTVRLSDARSRRLTQDSRSGEPIWGPDWIAYQHYRSTRWPRVGGLWLMRPDGSGKHLFLRGDQGASRAHYGLTAIKFSNDGRRLLACTVAEFGCSPVTIELPAKALRRFAARDFPPHKHALLAAEDMSTDGRRILVWVGSVDGAAPDDIYAIPFSGGQARLIAHHAISANWRGSGG